MKNPLDDLLATALQGKLSNRKKTSTRIAAEKRLPPDLHNTFDALASDYMEFCPHHVSDSKTRVNYGILADLVLAGWRKGPA